MISVPRVTLGARKIGVKKAVHNPVQYLHDPPRMGMQSVRLQE